MNRSREVPWNRILVESAAILVSILLAFAIDAWWAERQERIAEREELTRLYDEFATNRERLVRLVDMGLPNFNSSILSIIQSMDAAIEAGAEYAMIPDVQIAHLLRTITYEAETTMYDGLVRSGRFEIIKDQKIVSAIGRWERRLRSASEVDLNLRRLVDDQLIPALALNNSLRHILLPIGTDSDGTNIDPKAMTRLSTEPLIINLIALRHARTTVVIVNMTALRNDAEQVLSVISEFLGQ